MVPSDKFARLKAETDQRRIDFLRTDLQLCFTFASVAGTEHKIGDHEAAERSLADAEKAYATILRFLSDRKHTSHNPLKAQHDFKTELQRLRITLDELQRNMGLK